VLPFISRFNDVVLPFVGDVIVDSKASVVTLSIARSVGLILVFRGAHGDRVSMRARMSVYPYHNSKKVVYLCKSFLVVTEI
jgi:hypothetical protein